MIIEPREPAIAFDFGQATSAWFNTPGGKDYALRLWFWHSMAIFVMLIVTLPFILPSFGAYMEAAWVMNRENLSGGTPDLDPMLAALVTLIPGYLMLIVGLLLVSSLGEAAFYRKYLKGAEPAKIPIRLNEHTGRNMLAQLGFYLLYALVYILGIAAVAIIGGIFTAVFAPIGVVVIVLGFIGLLMAMVAYPIMFAPSAALTALNEKVHVFSTRKLTKHRFWPLFGAYLVTYIGGYIAYYIVYIIVLMLVTGDSNFMIAMSGLSSENPREIIDQAAERLANPLVMILGVLGIALLSAAWSAWMLWIAGVSAYAVRWWQSDDPTEVFD